MESEKNKGSGKNKNRNSDDQQINGKNDNVTKMVTNNSSYE